MRGILLWGAVLLVAACGGAGDGGGAAVTRDSAGIVIVENGSPRWQPGQEWRLADSALLEIGGDLDSVLGPVPLRGGRLAVAVNGSHQIRIYDSSGALQHSSGRTGSGPGEYTMLGGLWAGPGDSLMVLDIMIRRLSVLDDTAGYQRAFSLGGATGGAFVPVNGKIEMGFPTGWLPDGSVPAVMMSFAVAQQREGRFRDTVKVIRYGSDGSARDTMARVPGIEMETMTLTFGGQSMATPQPVPLGKSPVTVSAGDRLFVAQNNAWEIEVRRLDGALLRLIRRPIPPRPLTPEQVAAHRKELTEQMAGIQQLRNMPQILDQMKKRIEEAKYPATFSFISSMLVGSDGYLWVQEVPDVGVESNPFIVFDTVGVLLGRVSMPPRFRATAITSDRVYGVWKDEDDVPHVRAYRLEKGS